MDLCKIGTTIYIIVNYFEHPTTKIRYIKIKDINGNEQTVLEDSANPVSSSERSTFQRQLESQKLVPATPSSRFATVEGLAALSRPSVPVTRPSEPVPKPVRVYPQKACSLTKKGNRIYEFQLMDLSAKSFGGIEGMLPGVRWEFIGNCILTDAKSLDLFQFDASGKSAFQHSFFDHYHTLVSYCVEGGNHYACFIPLSQSIIQFVSWYIAQVTVRREELKQYMSHAEIELYRSFIQTREREERGRQLQEREDALRRELESRGIIPSVSLSAARLSPSARVSALASLSASARESALSQELARRYAVEPSTVAAARATPVSVRETPVEQRRREIQQLYATATVPLEQRASVFESPRATSVESNGPSIEAIEAARSILGYPTEGYLTPEQECWVHHFMATGQKPGQESANQFACIAKKSGRK